MTDEKFLISKAKLSEEREIQIAVPVVFGAEEFETAVGMLVQLRVASDRRKDELSGRNVIAVPGKRRLVAADGMTRIG